MKTLLVLVVGEQDFPADAVDFFCSSASSPELAIINITSPDSEAYKRLVAIVSSRHPQLTLSRHQIEFRTLPREVKESIKALQEFQFKIQRLLKHYKNNGFSVQLILTDLSSAQTVQVLLAAKSILNAYQDNVWARLSDFFDEHNPDSINFVSLPLSQTSHMSLHSDSVPKQALGLISEFSEGLLSNLTPAQQRTAQTLAVNRYASNRELANLLGISTSTVEQHLNACYQELVRQYGKSIRDRDKRHLLIQAVESEQGLIELEQKKTG